MSNVNIRVKPVDNFTFDLASTVVKHVEVEQEFIVVDFEVRKKLVMYKKVLEITPDFTFVSLLF